MPIYAYRCNACGHELEALQKISDPKLTDCPECHTANLSKQVTAAAFRLGGSGWYETDFKNGDKKNLASKDGHTEKPDKTGSETNKDGGKDSGKDTPKESTGATGKENTAAPTTPTKIPAATPAADKNPPK